MLLLNPLIKEPYFVSSFINGLKDEIKMMVKILKPESLSVVYEIAQLQERVYNLQSKKFKGVNKPVVDSKFGLIMSMETGGNNQYKVPSLPNKDTGNNHPEFKKLSFHTGEAIGLCFRCG